MCASYEVIALMLALCRICTIIFRCFFFVSFLWSHPYKKGNMMYKSSWKALDLQLLHRDTLRHLSINCLEATHSKAQESTCFLLLKHHYVGHFVHYVSMRTTESYGCSQTLQVGRA